MRRPQRPVLPVFSLIVGIPTGARIFRNGLVRRLSKRRCNLTTGFKPHEHRAMRLLQIVISATGMKGGMIIGMISWGMIWIAIGRPRKARSHLLKLLVQGMAESPSVGVGTSTIATSRKLKKNRNNWE